MRVSTFKHRLLALVLGALFVGLVPLVHAFCVAPLLADVTSMASTTVSMTHTMADGSTMVMTIPNVSAPTATEAKATSAEHTTQATHGSNKTVASIPAAITETTTASTLGSILVAVGLAVLTFFGIRRCAQNRASYARRAREEPPRRDRWPERLLLRPHLVNLDSLGISRT